MLHSVKCYSISTAPLKRSFKDTGSKGSRKHIFYSRKDYCRRKKWQIIVTSPLLWQWTAPGGEKFLFSWVHLWQDFKSEKLNHSPWWASSCFLDLLHSHDLSQSKLQLLLSDDLKRWVGRAVCSAFNVSCYKALSLWQWGGNHAYSGLDVV